MFPSMMCTARVPNEEKQLRISSHLRTSTVHTVFPRLYSFSELNSSKRSTLIYLHMYTQLIPADVPPY